MRHLGVSFFCSETKEKQYAIEFNAKKNGTNHACIRFENKNHSGVHDVFH
jgi:hypothetical protein